MKSMNGRTPHRLLILTTLLSLPALPALAEIQAVTSHEVERGAYLVRLMVCNDCHTPHRAGPNGPEPDTSRTLSGHREGEVVAAPMKTDGPWIWGGTGTMTAFSGPWGVSFAANLTPDPETGLGNWDAETFIQALRTGRHEGRGRPILPPMPWPFFRQATDEDLRAIFAYLRTLPPVRNKVPQPIDPPEE